MILPTTSATRYIAACPTTGNTKIPPCGAISVQLNAAESPPATPAPTTHAGMTCNGSAAANGIAPSVMKESPIIKFVGPALRSCSVNLFLNNKDAIAIAIGGTIPPIITAAMIS